MRVFALAVSTVVFAVSAAGADPIADRRAIMKERGGIVGSLVPIAKGEKPFDAAAVLDALVRLEANAKKWEAEIDTLFAPGTETGDTKASPKIWEDMAGFKAASHKVTTDVSAAVAAPPADLAAFQAQFSAITADCGSCHQAYRM